MGVVVCLVSMVWKTDGAFPETSHSTHVLPFPQRASLVHFSILSHAMTTFGRRPKWAGPAAEMGREINVLTGRMDLPSGNLPCHLHVKRLSPGMRAC